MRKIANTRRSTLLVALTATGLLAAGVLVAAPKGFLTKADANQDGAITQAEFDAVRAGHLAELDADNDGFVSFEEHKAAREARSRAMFVQRHDDNDDGRVSVDEMAGRGEGFFERMDRNKDGVVSEEEMDRGHRRGGPRHRMGH